MGIARGKVQFTDVEYLCEECMGTAHLMPVGILENESGKDSCSKCDSNSADLFIISSRDYYAPKAAAPQSAKSPDMVISQHQEFAPVTITLNSKKTFDDFVSIIDKIDRHRNNANAKLELTRDEYQIVMGLSNWISRSIGFRGHRERGA
jgi:hypothetical protein